MTASCESGKGGLGSRGAVGGDDVGPLTTPGPARPAGRHQQREQHLVHREANLSFTVPKRPGANHQRRSSGGDHDTGQAPTSFDGVSQPCVRLETASSPASLEPKSPTTANRSPPSAQQWAARLNSKRAWRTPPVRRRVDGSIAIRFLFCRGWIVTPSRPRPEGLGPPQKTQRVTRLRRRFNEERALEAVIQHAWLEVVPCVEWLSPSFKSHHAATQLDSHLNGVTGVAIYRCRLSKTHMQMQRLQSTRS
jgi:hypothetical protein